MAHRNDIPFWVLPMNLLLSLAVAILGAWVWLLSSHSLPPEQLKALELVYRQINDEYVKSPESEDLMWSAIEGMVGSLDRHSQFVRPAMVPEFDEDTTGTYAGIGIVMATGVMPLTVKFPFAGGPAERADLQVGDQILAVDGEPLEAADDGALQLRARERMLGEVGTSVTLTIKRGDEEPFDVDVERGQVTKPSVKWVRLLDEEKRVGYAYVESFQKRTTAELTEALQTLDELAGGDLRALVLDLRFDRGGLLDESIALANLFVNKGTIVQLKRRDTEVVQVREADPDNCVRPDLPLVLLVDHDSASASEVVAGALQDHGRAVLVGMRTYGKGVVQSIFSWRDLDFRLKLTTAYYYTPKGRSIEGENRREEDGDAEGGIQPNRVVPIADKLRSELYYRIHEPNEAPPPYRSGVRELAAKLGQRSPEPPGPDTDTQLAAALEEALRLIHEPAPAAK